MGRGGDDDTALLDSADEGVREDLATIDDSFFGGEVHRARTEAHARAAINRSDIRIIFSNFCGSCKHPLESHQNTGYSYCCGPDPELANVRTDFDCPCRKFIPGGSSHTDMKGNVTLQTNLPPDGSIGEREISVRGLLWHELSHELYTNREVAEAFWREQEEMRERGENLTAAQLQRLWNILEDGMIEERLRYDAFYEYRQISAFNRVYPRVGKDIVVEEEITRLAPEGYTPEDADGNPLTVEDRVDELGQTQKVVVIPAGTRISPWGAKPISLADQMESALLAESVPEYEAGELHPRVAEVLEECRPHIDAAVRGNTSDCVFRAGEIHAILRKHDMLQPDMENPFSDFGQDGDWPVGDPPPGGEDGDDGEEGGEDGDGRGPRRRSKKRANGGSRCKDNPLSEDLDDELNGEGGGKEDEKGDGSGAENAPQQVDSEGNVTGDGGGQSGQQSGDNGDAKGGHNADAPLPKGTREQSDSSGRGRVDGEDLEEMKREAEAEARANKEGQDRSNSSDKRGNKRKITTEDLEHRGSVVSERALEKGVHQSPNGALPDEQSELRRVGQRLSRDLKKIRNVARAPKRRQVKGSRLDRKRLHAVPSGDRDIYKNPGKSMNVDMRIEVVVDRSGSVTSDPQANTEQYRMSKMIGYAGVESGVPIGISGYSTGSSGTDHYVYKDAHSNSVDAVDSFFQTGGGTTPTDDGIAFGTQILRDAKEQRKVMIVVTDGVANNSDSALEQVQAARARGITVIGFGIGVGSQLSPEDMNKVFGNNQWQPIESYEEVPKIVSQLITDAAKQSVS